MMIGLVVGLCLAIPVLCLVAFVAGYRVARRAGDRRDIGLPDVFSLSPRPRAETDAERIRRITAQNIENYGTTAPQQEVK